MQDNYLISILGTQTVDGESDEIEVTTVGSYLNKNGKRYIAYTEYDRENPGNSIRSVLKVEDDLKVTIIRSGDSRGRLTLEKGRRHQCHYSTAMGDLMIGVFADRIDSTLDDSGGELNVSYYIDFNSDLMSRNSFKIKVKKSGTHGAENGEVSRKKAKVKINSRKDATG